MAMIRERTTRSNHIITNSLMLSLMSVPRIQGMEAEKNKISDIHTIAIMACVIAEPVATMLAGRHNP